MNIYVLNYDPVKNAQSLSDKHLVKQIDDVATLLCNAYPNRVAPRLRRHFDHPCTQWVRQSRLNFQWTIQYGLALLDEYEFRFGKYHPANAVIYWCRSKSYTLGALPWTEQMTPFPMIMPDQYKTLNVVNSYREFYMEQKWLFCTWTKRERPTWFKWKW